MQLKFDITQIITAWTATIAFISIVNKYILQPYLPKAARFVSAVISIPSGHLANAIEDFEQLWNDLQPPPPPPPANGGNGPVISAPPNPPPPPAATRGRIGLGLIAVAVLTLLGCTPAQFADDVQKATAIVIADLEVGRTEPQIEADVAQALAGQPGADVVIVVNDILRVLVDTHVINPPPWLETAKARLASVAPVAAAHRAALKVGE
jgi:hypothetical protein